MNKQLCFATLSHNVCVAFSPNLDEDSITTSESRPVTGREIASTAATLAVIPAAAILLGASPLIINSISNALDQRSQRAQQAEIIQRGVNQFVQDLNR